MARPKNEVQRKNINTTLKTELLEKLKLMSNDSGIPINRLIELALENSLDNIKIKFES